MIKFIVTFCDCGQMKTAKFTDEHEAKIFAENELANNNYPCVTISQCDGMKVLAETRLFK